MSPGIDGIDIPNFFQKVSSEEHVFQGNPVLPLSAYTQLRINVDICCINVAVSINKISLLNRFHIVNVNSMMKFNVETTIDPKSNFVMTLENL